jgi:hypothetical protein
LHGVSVLQGWRRDLMLERLKAFLRGREFIVLKDGRPTLNALEE